MRNVLLTVFACTMLFSFGCSRSSDLHEAMESMGDAMKEMRKSDELEQIQQELAEFRGALEVATQQKVKEEHQATFDEGMKKVQQGTEQIQQAIEQGNAELAKNLLKELHEVEEQYHQKLGVED